MTVHLNDPQTLRWGGMRPVLHPEVIRRIVTKAKEPAQFLTLRNSLPECNGSTKKSTVRNAFSPWEPCSHTLSYFCVIDNTSHSTLIFPPGTSLPNWASPWRAGPAQTLPFLLQRRCSLHPQPHCKDPWESEHLLCLLLGLT